jgi:hypothetical protein
MQRVSKSLVEALKRGDMDKAVHFGDRLVHDGIQFNNAVHETAGTVK